MSRELLVWMLLAQAFCSLFMLGLIWFVQVVHYPLFRNVGSQEFRMYELLHTNRTGYVVALPMMGEMLIALLLAWKIGNGYAWAGLGVLAMIWLGTVAWQIPAHGALVRGFNESTWRKLVRTNWLRTIGWSARGVISLLWIAKEMGVV
jgi:hypothetical protein